MRNPILTIILLLGLGHSLLAQDTSKSLININNVKIVKKINSILDSNQKKIASVINKKTDSLQSKIKSSIKNVVPKEIEKPLPYETLKDKKYNLPRRAYQNTVSQFNYFFNASEELKELISRARNSFQEDYTELLPFYDYDLSQIAKYSIDSIIYRCNANIVLHDLRSNWVDDAYLLLAKAYFYHKNFDTAGSILQFINYSFYDKDNGADRIMGSNLSTVKGKFSIASPDNNRIWENGNIRNESLVWQARNYFEIGDINEGMNLLKILQIDYNFPKYLHPFLHEQLAYGYYKSEMYDSAASNLIKGIDNAIDVNAKARWYFLIGQLYDKVKKHKEAYPWYEKASNLSLNPILSIYARINAIHILASENKEPWLQLTNSLEKMSTREKYKPYSDIIYFEMAKIALENKDNNKATEWLLQSIRKNKTNPHQKQSAFEILGNINYIDNHFSIAAKAYDSLNSIIKTHPMYETIQLRKKWLNTINENFKNIALEDSLQYIYHLPISQQVALSRHIQSYFEKINTIDQDIFIEKEIKKDKSKDIEVITPSSLLSSLNNSTENNTSYFDNKNTIAQGINQFKQKWGDRPNVDNWRRKTSNNIVSSNQTNAITSIQNSTTNTKVNNTIKDVKTVQHDSLSITLIKDSNTYKASIQKVADLTYKNASTFLFYLNDFDKAYPLYQNIIQKNYSSQLTERALLDLASAYIHKNQQNKSDSIISIVIKRFPDGFYMKKKKESEEKKMTIDQVTQLYKEAFFLSQIGNWDSLSSFHTYHQTILTNSKWNTPYQFLRVKMLAQQKKDSAAIVLLDSIIIKNQNESVRDKAKTIIIELKNRHNTEAYLASLVIQKPTALETPLKDDSNNKTNLLSTSTSIDANKKNKDSTSQITSSITKIDTLKPNLPFTNDSLEYHYIGIVMTNVKDVLVKETQNAFNLFHIDEYRKWNLSVSYVQFNEQQHIVWIGPFGDRNTANKYLNAVKPKLKDEIISFIPPKNYDLYIFGKSNILLIKNKEDLEEYKLFLLKSNRK